MAEEQAEVWGLGYGSRRHLVNLETRTLGKRTWNNRLSAQAQCSDGTWLDKFEDNETDRLLVMRKTMCIRCANKSRDKNKIDAECARGAINYIEGWLGACDSEDRFVEASKYLREHAEEIVDQMVEDEVARP